MFAFRRCQLVRFVVRTTLSRNMATTRTSSRQAAQKAKEAITSTAEPKGQGDVGQKRKGDAERAPEPKKGKKEEETTAAVKKEEPAKAGAGMIQCPSQCILLKNGV